MTGLAFDMTCKYCDLTLSSLMNRRFFAHFLFTEVDIAVDTG